MSSEVAIRERQTAPLSIGGMPLNGLDDLARVAKVIAASGMFKDANTPERAAVKMFFAMSMGFSPIAGLTGVDIIEGNPAPNASLWAAAIEDSPLYDYRVLERTNEKCRVAFLRWDARSDDWEMRGEVTWTLDDAKQAKLAGKDNWNKYPRAMLFHRCMTEGGRTYCPGLFGGVRAYDPEEIGGAPRMGETTQVVDAFNGEVIDLPLPIDKVDPAQTFVGEVEEAEVTEVAEKITAKRVTRAQVVRMFAIASESKVPDEDVKAVILEVAGVDSSKEIPADKYDAVIDALTQKALDLDAGHTEEAPSEDPVTGQGVLEKLKARHEDPA